MADLCQVIFSQTCHLHYSVAVDAVLQHGTGNFEFAFFNTTLFTHNWLRVSEPNRGANDDKNNTQQKK
ncbi:hypothetical protein SAMN03159353_105114 [Cedecea sp. NFIX57]|nr:hypothetical protein SAMN03159353_105114 [Cedecea sp. NFIX57]